MAKQELQIHGGSLTRPNKGETMNPNGRPRKFDTVLVNDYGYNHSEIADSIKVMLAMTIDELKYLLESEATILEKVIAVALLKSIKTGNISILESLLNRAYGKPKEMERLPEDKKQITGVQVRIIHSCKEDMEAAIARDEAEKNNIEREDEVD